MKLNKTRTCSIAAVGTGRIALLVIVVLQFFLTSEINAFPYQRTLRLCSRSLSDALFLVCKGRGFNEPFSYSGEDNYDEENRRPVPSNIGNRRSGLVQECCHRSCSIEHLERYCKPLPQPTRQEDTSSRGNAIALNSPAPQSSSGSYKIVNLPYSSVKKLQVPSVTIASIISDDQTARGRRRKKRRKNAGWRKYAKVCGCRSSFKQQQRNFRKLNKWRKVSRETVIPKVPTFQVGTTSPEPIDSIVIFPFKSELHQSQLERIDGNVDLGLDQDQDQEDLNRSRR